MQLKCDTKYYGYRGTTREWGEKCEAENRFGYSSGKDEYFGHGIYFFENDYTEAFNWATRTRRIKDENVAIIRSLIDAPADKTLDLINSEELKEFQKILEVFALRGYKEGKFELDVDIPYDCSVINIICEEEGYDLVRGSYTQNHSKSKELINKGFTRISKSHIQLCVRNAEIIIDSEVEYYEDR